MEHQLDLDAAHCICAFLDVFSLYRFVKACQSSLTLQKVVSLKSVFLPSLICDQDDGGRNRNVEIISPVQVEGGKLPFLQTFHYKIGLLTKFPQEKLFRKLLGLEDDRKISPSNKRRRRRNNDSETATNITSDTKQISEDELLSLSLVLEHFVSVLKNGGVFALDTVWDKRNVRLIDVWHTLHGLGFRSVPPLLEPVFTFFDCINRKHVVTLSDMALFDGHEMTDHDDNIMSAGDFERVKDSCSFCISFLCSTDHDWTWHELFETYRERRSERMELDKMDDDQVEEFIDNGGNFDEVDWDEMSEDSTDSSHQTLAEHIERLEYTKELFPDLSTLSYDHGTFTELVTALFSSENTRISSSALCFFQKAFEDIVFPCEVIRAQVKVDHQQVFPFSVLIGNNGSVVVRAIPMPTQDDGNDADDCFEDSSDEEFIPDDDVEGL